MNTVEKHYVTFYSPGSFVPETSVEPVAAWDPKLAAEMAERVVARYGAKPYAFAFHTQIEGEPVSDGRGGKLKVEPRCIATAPIHHLGGTVESFDDVEKRNDPRENILRLNMSGNEYWYVVINTNSFRSVQPFEADHVVVDASGTIVERGDTPERLAYRAKKTAERVRATELPSDNRGGFDG